MRTKVLFLSVVITILSCSDNGSDRACYQKFIDTENKYDKMLLAAKGNEHQTILILQEKSIEMNKLSKQCK